MKKLSRILAGFLSLLLSISMLSVPANATSADTTFKSWSQADSRWSEQPIGGGLKMAGNGCAVTALSKILVLSGEQGSDFHPGITARKLLEHGVQNSAGNMVWYQFNGAFKQAYAPHLTYSGVSNRFSYNQKAELVRYVGDLLAGDQSYLMVEVQKPSGGLHYIAVDKIAEGEVIVLDNGGPIVLHKAYPNCIFYIHRYAYGGGYSYPAVEAKARARISIKSSLPKNFCIAEGDAFALTDIGINTENHPLELAMLSIVSNSGAFVTGVTADGLDTYGYDFSNAGIDTEGLKAGKYRAVVHARAADGTVAKSTVSEFEITAKKPWWVLW